jgi:transposase InsO family protein
VRLTKKNIKYEWGWTEQRAFEILKAVLCDAPLLAHPKADLPFILDTDASAMGIGGVLSQVHPDGVERVIAYGSVTLSRTERNYCTTKRELLAVVVMVKKFRHYLWGRKFRLRTDHASLTWLLNFKDADGMLQRWISKLEEYHFTMEHRDGKKHCNADGMSRLMGSDCEPATETYSTDSMFDDGVAGQAQPHSASVVSPVWVYLQHQTEELTKMGITDIQPRGWSRGNPRNIPGTVMCVFPEAGTYPAPEKCQATTCVPGTNNRGLFVRHNRLENDPMYIFLATADLGYLEVDTLGETVSESGLSRADRILDQIPMLAEYSTIDIGKAQENDADLKPIRHWVTTDTKPTVVEFHASSFTTKSLIARWKELSMEDDILYRNKPPADPIPDTIRQIVLPLKLRKVVLKQLHNKRLSGHLGIRRTMARIEARFYWPGSSTDVRRWIQSCVRCSMQKNKPAGTREFLGQEPRGGAFECIGADIMDTHKVSKRGNRYILLVVDYFTKWAEAFPLKQHTALKVAQVLMERVIVQHGVPTQLHTDQGAEFTGELIKQLSNLLEIRKSRTSPYHPQSDGMVERGNRTLKQMLGAYCNERANDWDDHLPLVMSAYRSSVHDSTGCTPFSMLYGREMNLPVDLMFPDRSGRAQKQIERCGPAYVEWIREYLTRAHQFARHHLRKAAIRQKRNYDKRSKFRTKVSVGDLVRYRRSALECGNKFGLPWVGPYKVVDFVGDYDVKIVLVRGKLHREAGIPTTVHLNDVKLYGKPTTSEEESDTEPTRKLRIHNPRHRPKDHSRHSPENTDSDSEDEDEPRRRSRRLRNKSPVTGT